MATQSTSTKATLKITSFILRLLMNIIFYIFAIILIVNVSKEAFKFTYQLYGPVALEEAPGREIIFQIKEGESTMDIASKLEHNRAIVNKYSFYLKTKLQNLIIMPGTYVINSAMTYKEILDIITDYSASIIQDETKTETETGSASDADTNTDSNTETDAEEDSQTGSGEPTEEDTQTGDN
jgi:UPF0755 protein